MSRQHPHSRLRFIESATIMVVVASGCGACNACKLDRLDKVQIDKVVSIEVPGGGNQGPTQPAAPAQVPDASVEQAPGGWTAEKRTASPGAYVEWVIGRAKEDETKLKARIVALTTLVTRFEREGKAAAADAAEATTLMSDAKDAYRAAQEKKSTSATLRGYPVPIDKVGDQIVEIHARVSDSQRRAEEFPMIAKRLTGELAATRDAIKAAQDLQLEAERLREQIKLKETTGDLTDLANGLSNLSDTIAPYRESPLPSIDDLLRAGAGEKTRKQLAEILKE